MKLRLGKTVLTVICILVLILPIRSDISAEEIDSQNPFSQETMEWLRNHRVIFRNS